MVRFFTPESRMAWISVSGMPHRPKPPAMIIMPSLSTPASAALASGNTFFMQPHPVTLGPLQAGQFSVAEGSKRDQGRWHIVSRFRSSQYFAIGSDANFG